MSRTSLRHCLEATAPTTLAHVTHRTDPIRRVSLFVAAAAAVALAGPGCSRRALDMGGRSSGASALNSNPRTPDFALYAQNSMALGDRTAVTGGDVGVRLAGSGPFLTPGSFELFLSSGVRVDSTRSVLANRLRMVNGAHAGDIQVNEFSDPSRTATYTHQYTFPASSMPALPPLAPVSPGTNPITIGQSSTVPSNSGSYGVVSIGNHGVWRLQGGVYQIASLQMDNDARIEALAPVQLRIAGRLSAQDRVYIVPAADVTLSAGDLRIEVSGRNGASGSLSDTPKAVAIANDPHIRAVFLVPNGTFQSGARSTMTGAYVAKDISIGNESPITYQSGVDPAGCLGCDDGNPCTVDDCSTGACTHTPLPENASCADSDACNGAETCDGNGHCRQGTPVSCPPINDGCHAQGNCQAQDGTCDYPRLPSGTVCGEGGPCREDSRCSDQGVCEQGSEISCPGSRCLRPGICDPDAGGCVNEPIDEINCNIFLRMDGIVELPGGTRLAVFGYDSSATGSFIPESNQFFPDVAKPAATNPDPAPPSYFLPGSHIGSFLPKFEGQRMKWVVDGIPIEASSDSPILQPISIGSGGVGVKIGDTVIPVQPDPTPYITPPREPTHDAEPPVDTDARFTGTLGGKLTIGQSGAAVYTLPIAIPPGVAGMSPNLNLVYNSQSQNGALGLGWSMTGLSMIHRCPKTRAEDGYVKAVEMGEDFTSANSSADGVCLDGKRLFSSQESSDEVQFTTELTDFSTIKYIKSTGGFTVTTKSGETRYYGSGSDSRLSLPYETSSGPQPEKTPVMWGLDKVQDLWGNYYEVHYNERDLPKTSLWASSIHYAGNEASQLEPFNEIQFDYGPRPDPRNTRFRSSIVPVDRRLTSISTPRGTYTLTYMDPDPLFPSRLRTISYCSVDGNDCAQDLEFQWEEVQPGWYNNGLFRLPKHPLMGGQFIDLDGDGRLDYVVSVRGPDGPETNAYRNDGNSWVAVDEWTLPSPLFQVSNFGDLGELPTFFADFDGDGLPDLFTYSNSPDWRPAIWLNRLREGHGWELRPELSGQNFVDALSGVPFSSLNGMKTLPDWSWNFSWYDYSHDIVTDIDGDGQAEVVHFGTAEPPSPDNPHDCNGDGQAVNHKYRVYVLHYGANQWSLDTTSYGFWAWQQGCTIPGAEVYDINRDGLPDLKIWLIGNRLNVGNPNDGEDGTIWRSTGLNPFKDEPFGNDSSLFEMGRADIDGDGIYDAVASQKNESDPSNPALRKGLAFAAGLGWSSKGALFYLLTLDIFTRGGTTGRAWDAHRDYANGTYQLADVNGDGLADLIVAHSWGARIFPNTGRAWLEMDGATDYDESEINVPPADHKIPGFSSPRYTPTKKELAQYNTFVAYIDIDGDGAKDRVQSGYEVAAENTPGRFTSQTYLNQLHPPVIRHFPNGLADKTDVNYAVITAHPLIQDHTVYEDTNGLPDGTKFAMVPLRVVETVWADNGIGSTSKTTYKYTDLRGSTTGRGLQGFRWVTVTEPSGIVTTTEYHQAFPLTGMPKSVVRTKDGVTLTETSTTYDPPYTPGMRNIFVRPKEVTDLSHLDNSTTTITTKTTFSYDSFGNPSHTEVSISDGPTPDYVTTTDNTYGGDSSEEQKLGKPTKTVVTTKRLDQDGHQMGYAREHTTTFEYDHDNFGDALPLIKKKVEPNLAIGLRLDTAYDYDFMGNLTVTVVCATDFDRCTARPVGSASGESGSLPFRVTTVSYDPEEFDPAPGGGQGRETKPLPYGYGRFPVKTTRPEGQVEYVVYDPLLGAIKQSTGPNGIHTCRTYDALGWQTSETARCGSDSELTTTTDRYLSHGSGCELDKVVTVTRPPTGATTWAYSDALGRNVLTYSRGFDLNIEASRTIYDELGRVQKTHAPVRTTDEYFWTTTEYDWLSRPWRITREIDHANHVNFVRTMGYQGNWVTTTDSVRGEDRTEWQRKNVLGKVEHIEDLNGKAMNFDYDADGNLTDIYDTNRNHIQIYVNGLGRKYMVQDPDLGTWWYDYDGFGDLILQKDAKQQKTTMTYDGLGRITTKTDAIGTSQWIYDQASGAGKGKVAAIMGPPDPQLKGHCDVPYVADSSGNRTARWFNYTPWGEVDEAFECANGAVVSTKFTYDDKGRQSTVSYPEVQGARFTVQYNYTNETGVLQYLSNVEDGSVLWQATAMNGLGQVTQEKTQNGVTTDYQRHPGTGWLLHSTSATEVGGGQVIQDWAYTYDEVGNLLTRSRSQPGQMADSIESFTYDVLDRLKTSELQIPLKGYDSTHDYDYDDLGNINRKDGNTYSYTGCESGGGPHAVCQVTGSDPFRYDANGNMVKGNGRGITYSPSNKPVDITADDGNVGVHFAYGPDGNRVVQSVTGPDGRESARTVYVGLGNTGKSLYERTTTGNGLQHVHFVYAGGAHGGSAFAVYVVDEAGISGDARGKMEYNHFDHLGSVTAMSDESGRVRPPAWAGTEATVLDYDPWGVRRNPDATVSDRPFSLQPGHREFTGHETIPSVGLVNMNGRVYDPGLGRFLSADPNVQFAMDTQSYNRYSYAQNNPLRYIDPTGYSIGGFLDKYGLSIIETVGIVSACVGFPAGCAAAGMMMAGLNATAALMNGAGFQKVVGGMIATAAIGAATGGAAGAVFGSELGLTGAILSGATAGAISGAITTKLFGGSYGTNILLGAAMGAVTASAQFRYQQQNAVSQRSVWEQGGDSPASTARCGEACRADVRKALGGGPVPGDTRTGWDLFRMTGDEAAFSEDAHLGNGSVPLRKGAVLQTWVVDRLQPVLDKYGLNVDLATEEIFLGTNDGRGRSPSLGIIRLSTPGSGTGSFWDTADSLLHELGHQVQMSNLGEQAMLNLWSAERTRYGDIGAYYKPHTLEWQANQFAGALLPELVR